MMLMHGSVARALAGVLPVECDAKQINQMVREPLVVVQGQMKRT
jgi:hypothetical protein